MSQYTDLLGGQILDLTVQIEDAKDAVPDYDRIQAITRKDDHGAITTWFNQNGPGKLSKVILGLLEVESLSKQREAVVKAYVAAIRAEREAAKPPAQQFPFPEHTFRQDVVDAERAEAQRAAFNQINRDNPDAEPFDD
jgi:hypothetical protein